MKRLLNIICSYWFTTVLAIIHLISYLYFTPEEEPYSRWLRFLYFNPLGTTVHILLILNLLALSMRSLINHISTPSPVPNSIKKMDIHTWTEISHENSLSLIEERLKKKGFSVKRRDNGITATKGRYSFLPVTLTGISLALLLTALLLSAHLRSVEEGLFYEGISRTIYNKKLTLKSVDVQLPERFIQIGEKSLFHLKNVRAEILSSQQLYTVTTGFPEFLSGVYAKISHLGFYQPIEVSINGVFSDIEAYLDILPPGKTDILSIPSKDIIFTFTLKPEKTMKKGLITGKIYNLQKPYYHIVLQHTSNTGETTSVDLRPPGQATLNGITLTLAKTRPFVKLQLIKDPAIPILYISIPLLLIGGLLLFTRIFWYKKAITVFIERDRVLIGYEQEYYKRWIAGRFIQLKKEIFDTLKREVI
jgi:hypothetical protein